MIHAFSIKLDLKNAKLKDQKATETEIRCRSKLINK